MVEKLQEQILDLIAESECDLATANLALDLVKTELLLAHFDDDGDDEAEEVEGEFESDGVVGE
jgi:hypothetical protein